MLNLSKRRRGKKRLPNRDPVSLQVPAAMNQCWSEATDKAIRASNIDHVFCGHFHTEFSIQDGYNLNVTPSPALGVEQNEIKPKFTPPRIPIREITIQSQTTNSCVVYL
jgi:hypothetical protein